MVKTHDLGLPVLLALLATSLGIQSYHPAD